VSLRTPLCDLLQIDVPIVQASIGPWSTPQLAAAVSNAGAIGSQGTALVPPQRNREQVRRIRELTDRPFIVNHTARPLSEEAFAVTLEERPPAISYALGDPGELVSRALDAGIRFLQQVHTVEQAERAAAWTLSSRRARRPAVPAATSGRSRCFRRWSTRLHRSPSSLPAGSQTAAGSPPCCSSARKGSTSECVSSPPTKPESLRAGSYGSSRRPRRDAVRAEFADAVFPPATGEGYGTRPRVPRTPFVDEWNAGREEIGPEAERLSAELVASVRENRAHVLVPFTGQTAGMIRDVLPAAEIVGRLVSEAEAALRSAPRLAG